MLASPTARFLLPTLLLALLVLPLPTQSYAQSTSPAQAAAQNTQQPIQPVTTTVVVHDQAGDDYLPSAVSIGNLGNLPLADAPISATVVTRDVLSDQITRTLADVVKNDASIGEDYAPVGYYGDFQIRGIPVDLATGLQINGLTIAGEQDVPLENKERVEFLKGIAGLESGITSAGGLINYVTKRPAHVRTLDFATDHRGTSFGALDFGQLFGTGDRYGLRVNLAGEEIKSYVEDANGTRGVGAASFDVELTKSLALKTDFEYQHRVQRSVAGYQLLGGSVVPSLSQVFPSNMLGDQPWSKPNTFDAFNSGSRLDWTINSNWRAWIAGSYSHSLIDDNVIYPYGCYYEDICNTTVSEGGALPYFFAPDGTYDIYDYRSPGELRTDALGEAILSGTWKTGPVTHHLTGGGELFHRGVDLSPSVVYTYIGSENIYQPNQLFPIEDPVEHAGPSVLADFNHQSAGILQDRAELPGHINLTAGGRYASISDFNYTGSKGTWLPQFSATWAPVANLMLYGNYSVMLSLGPQAPFWAENGSEYLAPFFTRQAEVGAKYQPGRILLTAALFRMRTPFFYPKVDPEDETGASLIFLGEGHETHRGFELNAEGKAASWLHLSTSVAGIEAISEDTGTPAFDNKQVINVPRLKAVVFADVALPGLRGSFLNNLHILPGWSVTGRKEATRDDAVSVGGYNLFNLGAKWTPGGESGHVSFHLFADNILNKRYWKDTGANFGDTFIHLGAPTTVRISAQYRF